MLGLFDLSIITDALVRQVDAAVAASPIWSTPPAIEVTGAAPESKRTDNGGSCVLSIYLIHATANAHTRNSPLRHHNAPPSPRSVPLIPFQPLGLDLYYIVTAWAGIDYVREQQAMSVAIKWFHEHPVIRKSVTVGDSVAEDFTVTMEATSLDDLGQLWQAVNVAPRLATMYRVSVVFLTPPAAAALAPPPKRVGLAVGQTGRLPLLLGSSAGGLSPAVATLGETIAISGLALDERPAGIALDDTAVAKVFLLESGERDVTSWRSNETADGFDLTLPATFGAPPAAAPAPGVYQVRVGFDEYRSNATPITIAAQVTPPAAGQDAILDPVNGLFTIAGAGFVRTKTELVIGGKALVEKNAAPTDGEFLIVADGTSIEFRLPAAGIPAGTYDVAVRVSGVQSAPAWRVVVP